MIRAAAALLGLFILVTTAAAQPRPKPSLTGAQVYASTAAIPTAPAFSTSSFSTAAFASLMGRAAPSWLTAPLKLSCMFAHRAELLSAIALSPRGLADSVFMAVGYMPDYAETDKEYRKCGLDGETAEDLVANSKLFQRRRGDILADLAVLQQTADTAADHAAWRKDSLNWTVSPESRKAFASRRPRAKDFVKRDAGSAAVPEHERTAAPLKAGELEFKP